MMNNSRLGPMFFMLLALMPHLRAQQAPTLGDLDGDGVATVRDIAVIAGHFSGTTHLSEMQRQYADVNKDGAINDSDMDEMVKEILGTRQPETLPLSSIRSSSPASGEGDVAVTRETIVHFTVPLSLSAALDTTKFKAEFGGKKILSRVDISSDRKKATLFYLEPLPSNARIQLTFDGRGLTDLIGRPFDADGDGAAGGVWVGTFDTLSITPVAGTAITGRVFASKPATGPDGQPVDVPLAGATITVDGAEETMRAVTDAQGNFTLLPCPAGSFFVHVDGRTSPASSWPGGDYYPTVGKRWEAVASRTDNLSGSFEDTARGTIYLPCVCAGSLQTVSATQDTSIGFPAAVLAEYPALVGTTLTVPANSLFADDGTRGGKIGIAPVPPTRLPSPLPPGLNPAMVITVQSDGGSNFDRPVPVCLPNLPDPVTGVKLGPGGKSAWWSFNHDLGNWEVIGPMTVTADGNFIKTDPGVGIHQPGWGGAAPGSQGTASSISITCPNGSAALQRVVGISSEMAFDTVALAGGVTDAGIGLIGNADIPFSSPFLKFLGIASTYKNALQCGKDVGDSTKTWYERALPCAQATVGVAGIVATFVPGGVAIKAAITVGGLALDSVDLYGKSVELDDAMLEARLEAAHTAACPEQAVYDPEVTPTPEDFLPDEVMPDIPTVPEIDEMKQKFQELKTLLDDNQALIDRVAVADPNNLADDLTEDEWNTYTQKLSAIGQVADSIEPARITYRIIIQRARVAQVIQTRIGQTFRPPPPRQPSTGSGGSLPGEGVRRPLPITPSSSFACLKTRNFERRFQVSGRFTTVLPPSIPMVLRLYSRWNRSGTGRNMIGSVFFFGPPNGTQAELPSVLMGFDDGTDTDGDTLSDAAENIIGTLVNNRDTDGDGISDGVEVDNGSDPASDRPLATGVIASSPTTFPLFDVSVFNALGAAAMGQKGVTVFDARSGLAPTRLAELDTTGTARRVSVTGSTVAVADMEGGLAIIDASDPRSVFQRARVTVGGMALSVVASGPLAYVGTDLGDVVEVDLFAGQILRRLTLGSGSVDDLALSGDYLYASHAGTLHAIPLLPPVLAVSGSLPMATGRLSAGRTLLHCARAGSLDLFNLADPAHPAAIWLRTPSNTPAITQFLQTESGLGLAVSPSLASLAAPVGLHLYDIGANGRDLNFLVGYGVGAPSAATIYNGMAWVAGGSSLSILNYRSFDNLGQPPVISLTANIPLNPGSAEEGKVFRLTAEATDDVQIHHVDFFQDGEGVAADGNYPYEIRLLAPALTATKTSFTLRARATDTGGNSTWSQEYVVALTLDTTPPVVLAMAPANGALVDEPQSVTVVFNEPMGLATLSGSGISLSSAGADGIHGTADDQGVTSGFFAANSGATSAGLAFNTPLPSGKYRLTVGPPLADAGGVGMVQTFTSSFQVAGSNDADNDGIRDDWELVLGTNPNLVDSDGDGIPDGREDFDNDGLTNAGEFVLGTNPRLLDTDGNGISDGLEDTDFDGLADGQEIIRGTDPRNIDTDGDGWDDAGELVEGTDPLESNSAPPLRLSSLASSFLNALPQEPEVGSFPVVSVQASYLNSLPLGPDVGSFPVVSAPASYLNWLAFGPDIGSFPVVSAPASFLNSLPFGPDADSFPVFSLPASYRNDPAAGLSLVPNQ